MPERGTVSGFELLLLGIAIALAALLPSQNLQDVVIQTFLWAGLALAWNIAGGYADGSVLDIGVATFVARDLDAEGLLLILPCQCDDAARQRRRKQQRAAGVRCGLEDKFHILAKTQIEHLVGLVEHNGLQFRDVETAAPQVIA